MQRKHLLGLMAIFTTVTGMVITGLSISNNSSLHKDVANTSNYTLTLNSQNAYLSGTSQSVTTDSGNYQVTFNYTNCSSKNNYHALINNGGTIVNAEHIRSINEFYAIYDGGTLKAKTSYDGQTWGEYFTLVSNQKYSFSDVYYVSLLAVDSVNLLETKFNYSCLVNPDAHEGESGGSGYYEKVTSALEDYSGKYLIVYDSESKAFNGGLTTFDAVNNYVNVSITNQGILSNTTTDAASFTLAKKDSNYTIKSASGYYIGNTSNNNSVKASTTETYSNTVSYDDISSSNSHLRYNAAADQQRFRYYKSSTYTSQKPISLYKLSEGQTPDIPKDEIGFTAVDNNKDNYLNNSIFDTANGINAVVQYSDGTSKNLAKGDYSYQIFNSLDEQIDTSKAFGNVGAYKLRISYKTFVPVEITLNVGEYIYLTGLTASMTNKEFTTDDKLVTTIASNITASKTYSNPSSNVDNIAYSAFASNNLVLSLYDPNNVSKSINDKFAIPGTWKVKVTCSEDANISASIDITVSSISVTSVTLSQTALSLKENSSATLTATVLPDNATDKSVTWSSDTPTVASVSNQGVVTAIKEGSAIITATANDGSNAKGTCLVTVSKSTTTTATIAVNGSFSGTSEINLSTSDFATDSISLTNVSSTKIFAGANDNEVRFSSGNYGGQIVFTFDAVIIKSVKLNVRKYSSDNSKITVLTSANTDGQQLSIGSSAELVFDAFKNDSEESTTLTVLSEKSNRFYLSSIELTIDGGEPIYPTAISLSGSSTIGIGQHKTLEVTYTPSNTNQKYVTFESNKTSVATVTNEGVVTGVSVGSAKITAKALKEDNTYATATFDITVTEQQKDAWTIMIYMCGSDLESENGLASMDLDEIKTVNNQPSDVNIIIEAGGSSSWNSSYSSFIDAQKLNRFHLRNKNYVKDEQINIANMGESGTFQSFLEWGLTEYPAEKTGVILWNHGGGLYGACYDENANDDSLDNAEVKQALNNAFSNTGTSKLEWIGYDCCLMQTQEVADFNVPYFNYMVASQESESGYGWDYDTWLDDLYTGESTETILTAIVDGFIADNGGVNATGGYYQGQYYPADQTLSFLNLNYFSAYKTAWEAMAGQLKNKLSSKGSSGFLTNVLGKTKYFGGSDYDYFSVFDVKHFLTLLSNNSTYNPGSTYINNCISAFNNLVVHNVAQNEAAHDANGLSFWFNIYIYQVHVDYCDSEYIGFSNWLYICNNYHGEAGTFASSYNY